MIQGRTIPFMVVRWTMWFIRAIRVEAISASKAYTPNFLVTIIK